MKTRSTIIVGGKPVCISADVLTWEEHGMRFEAGRGARVRQVEPRIGVLHFTGAENPPERVYRNLRRRKIRTKERHLGVDFMISREGVIYQFSDPAHLATIHAGYVNGFSWGVEVVCYGYRRPRRLWTIPKIGRDRIVETEVIHGFARRMAQFYTQQSLATIALVDTMCEYFDIPRRLPRDEHRRLINHAMPRSEVEGFSGVLAHLHIKRTKLDSGINILNALSQLGY